MSARIAEPPPAAASLGAGSPSRSSRSPPLVATLAVPPARTAILDWLGIGSARITIVDELPRSTRFPGSRSSAIASPSSRPGLEQASPYAPPPDGEPAPDEMRVAPGMRVAYLWRDGDRVRLLVTQFPGSAADDPALVKKLVGSGTSVEELEVDGDRAVWLEGGPHVVLFAAPDGTIREDNGWLAGNTLLVARDGVTVRVEGDMSRLGRRAPRPCDARLTHPSNEGSRPIEGGTSIEGSKPLERVMTPPRNPTTRRTGEGRRRAAPVRLAGRARRR